MSHVSFDANSYRIDDQPVWLLSGEMHYFKLTRGEWRRRLVQLKTSGFNAVSVYMPWNYHEITPGQWDFSGDRDVEHFLEIATELGLYVVARPGPYICNEWLAGGLPPWLIREPGIRPRTADPRFLAAVDRWFDRIVPIFARFQPSHGGTVIMAQVENEYGHYGEAQEADYIYHLRDALRERGIDVPIITCDSFINFARLRPSCWDGIQMCCNFGGNGLRILERARAMQPDAPLFITEYWIAAFDWWGRHATASMDDQRALNGALEIAAGGAGGLTAFVFSGGSHFGYWHGRSICSSDNFMTTLYGPGAPVLDDGRFSGKYQLMKNRLAPLVHCGLATAGMPEESGDPAALLRTVRRGPDGTCTFLLNRSSEQIAIAEAEKDQACVDQSIPAGAVRWQPSQLRLPGGQTLVESDLQLFATSPALVLFGRAGSNGSVRFADGELTVQVPVDDAPALHDHYGLPILVLNDRAIERCWRIDMPGAPVALVGGPDRIEDVAVRDGSLHLQISAGEPSSCWRYGDGALTSVTPAFQPPAEPFRAPLDGITVSHSLPELAPDFDDSGWFAAEEPQPLIAFGHGQGWAWYRCRFQVAESGPQMICLSGAADRMHAWVDGRYLGARGSGTNLGWNLMPSLAAGEHVVSLLVENLGMFNSGAEFDIPLCEPKGLYGPIWLNGADMTGWRMRAGVAADETLDTWTDPRLTGWQPAGGAFSGPGWIRGSFSAPDDFDGAVRLDLAAAGKGSVWLNGWNVGRYWKLGPQQSLWLPLDKLRDDNELLIFEELTCDLVKLGIDFTPFGHRAAWHLA